MEDVYDATQDSGHHRRFYAVEDGMHNDTYARGGQPYFYAIRNFMALVVADVEAASS